MKQALIIFTKIPIVGFTKTRLQNFLTPEQCAELTTSFLKDLFLEFSTNKNFDIFLFYTPIGKLNTIKNLVPKNISIYPQVDGDIGEKMFSAMNFIFNNGYNKIVLIGSDIPEITQKEIQKSFLLLDNKDIVFGATLDGGYYLIAANKDKFTKNIFNLPKKWSTNSVMDETMVLTKKLNLNLGFVKTLQDIDTKKDLFEFYERIKNKNTASHKFTKKFLNEVLQ